MDENGEILLLHASKNNTRPLVLPWFNDFEFLQGVYQSNQNIYILSVKSVKMFTTNLSK